MLSLLLPYLLQASFVLGPEVVVSDQLDGGDLRCEPSVAVSGNYVAVSWNDSYGGSHGSQTGVAIGWSISTDRGKTYRFGGYLAPGAKESVSGADSRLAVAGNGDFLLLVLQWEAGRQALRLYAMNPTNEKEFREVTTVAATTGDPYIDKPSLFCDGNRAYIAYTLGGKIAFTSAEADVKKWIEPKIISEETSKIRTGVGIAARGERIVVAWEEGTGMATSEVWCATSSDAGKTFASAKKLLAFKQVPTPSGFAIGYGPFDMSANDVAILPPQKSGQPFTLTYAVGDGESSTLNTVESVDGVSWTTPRPVAGPKLDRAWFPAAAGGPTDALICYARTDFRKELTDVYFCSGERAIPLTTMPTNWLKVRGDKAHAPIQRNFGDYISLAGDSKGWVAAWTDGRGGKPQIMARTIAP